MRRHANPRVYIGPHTNELVLSVDRIYGLGVKLDSKCLKLNVVKRGVRWFKEPQEWTAYAVDHANQAKFMIPDCFLSGAVKGFFDAQLILDDCVIAEIELVKAPSVGAICATTIDKVCGETAWSEPGCDPVEEQTQDCGCSCGGDVMKSCSCSAGVDCYVCTKRKCTVIADITPEYSGIHYAN